MLNLGVCVPRFSADPKQFKREKIHLKVAEASNTLSMVALVCTSMHYCHNKNIKGVQPSLFRT